MEVAPRAWQNRTGQGGVGSCSQRTTHKPCTAYVEEVLQVFDCTVTLYHRLCYMLVLLEQGAAVVRLLCVGMYTLSEGASMRGAHPCSKGALTAAVACNFKALASSRAASRSLVALSCLMDMASYRLRSSLTCHAASLYS